MQSQLSDPTQSEPLFSEENRQAEDYIASNDLPEAAAILVKIVENDPQNWRAFNNMGILSWMQKAWDDAFAMFKKALDIKPEYSDAIVNLFDACLKLRKIEILPHYLKKALEIDPNIEEASIILEAIEDSGEDIYQCERAMIVGTKSQLIDEGNQLLSDGKINEAMAKFLESNDKEGPTAQAFCGLGIVSYYQKRYLDAYTLFLESIKLNPSDSDTFVNLLDSAKLCNRVSEAKKIFELYSKEIPSLKKLEIEFEQATE